LKSFLKGRQRPIPDFQVLNQAFQTKKPFKNTADILAKNRFLKINLYLI
jgi:hypothetical protein